MAANLTIGRIGLDIDMAHPTQIDERSDGVDGMVTIRGYIKDTTTMEEAKHLRTQLLSQVASNRHTGFVAVDCVVDPTINGFYYLENASIEVSRRAGSLISPGHFPYTVSLRRVNSSAFSVALTGGVLTNSHSHTSGSPLVGAPQGAISYTPEASGTVSRGGTDGTLEVFVDVDETDAPIYELDPNTPLDMYEGGCRILVAKTGTGVRRLISGFDLGEMNAPLDWEIHNSLVRVEGYSESTRNGFTISLAPSVSGWESDQDFYIGDASNIGPWSGRPTIIRNDPEQATIRVTQHRSGNQIGRRSLDITVRRGQRFAHFLYHTSVGANIGVHGWGASTATEISPWGIRRTSNDTNGHRWILGSKSTTTKVVIDPPNITGLGGNTVLDFFAGFEVDGSSAQTNDTAADIYEQYLHHLNEIVTPIVPSGVVP